MGWTPLAKAATPPFLWEILYRALIVKNIPDGNLYRPTYSPWESPEFKSIYVDIRPYTEVSIDRCWTLYQMIRQAMHAAGDVMEAGVYRGGTARMLRKRLVGSGKRLYLFDSFDGMKTVSSAFDRHKAGDFADTSLEGVQDVVGRDSFIDYRKGWVPETFAGLESSKFCFSHIDLDLYQSVSDCLKFVYERTSPGGVIISDDYGFPSCPGARRAVDEFFADKPEFPLALVTGQALVIKL